jgi:SAM-dependent methyltransferase
MLNKTLLSILACHRCYSSLIYDKNTMMCDECKIYFPIVDNIPRFHGVSNENIINYDTDSVTKYEKFSKWRKYNYKYIETNLKNLNKSAFVFDVGAGTQQFAKLFETDNVYKTDYLPYKSIDITTNLTKPLPIKNNVFDVVVLSNVLEHISEPLLLLKECNRVLKVGTGKLIITVPFLIKLHQEPHDYYRYTEYILHKLLDQVGFTKVEITKIGNFFDIYSSYTNVFCQILSGYKSDNYKKYKFRILSIMYRIIFKLLVSVSRIDLNQVDEIGYPWGYGVIAYKK